VEVLVDDFQKYIEYSKKKIYIYIYIYIFVWCRGTWFTYLVHNKLQQNIQYH
jgi:hypothetical protein